MVSGEENMILNLLKDWRVLLVIILVALSLFAIAPSFQKGVIVTSISSDSPLFNIVNVGEIITWINEKDISTPEDFYIFDDFTGNLRFIHNGKLDIVNIQEPGLGVIVKGKPRTNLNFGLDLVGGTRVLLKPKENVSDIVMQQIIATLETRINIYGLKEAKFQQVKDVSGNNYAQIEMAGGTKEEIENLLAKQGKFEGKIPIFVNFKENISSFMLGDNNYTVELQNNQVKINNELLSINDTSKLNGIEFEVFNLTNQTAVLMFTVFTGSDIKSVCMQDQPGICVSRILQLQEGWQFQFQVFISEESAKKFADITKNMKIITNPTSGEKYLESKIYLYMDEKEVSSLGIAAELKGKAYTTPLITGFRSTRSDALQEKLTLQSILQSGSLPVSLEIIKIDQISPSLGQEFFKAAIIAAIIAEIAVAGVIFFRYRKIKILIPMMLWSASELILILGAASLIKWTIDLAAIAGIIAAIGTGTNDQIMIIDEILIGGGAEKKIYTLKQRIKRAFFIIFGAAGTIIAAMLPLMFVGIGVMRGFAITTVLGILIGIVITRPAFGRVAEKILEEHEI
ncbi:MAG: hypothetical protein ACE5J4_00200 [Candidatus Aenigmatarchaeota archaeon]